MEKKDNIELLDEQDPRAYMWIKYRRYPFLLAKYALIGAILFIVGYALKSIDSVLFPILISLLIAYLLDPLIRWFETKKMSRTIAILIVILLLITLLTIFSLVLYPTFSTSISTLTIQLPKLGESVFTDIFPWVEDKFGFKLPSSISATLSEYRSQIQQQIPDLIQKMSSATTNILTQSQAIFTSLVNIVMIPVFSFYFLRDFDDIREYVLRMVPDYNNEKIMKRLTKMDTVVGAWFRGQLTVAAILAVLYSIGLGIVFGISGVGVLSGIGIGILTGFLNIIPYFGVAIGAITSVLMVLIAWNGIWPLIGLAIVFGIVQVLEGYVITPKIVGDAVGLSPVVVIIVLLIGGSVFGITGVLLATPVAGVIKVLLPDIIAYYKNSSFYTGKYVTDPIATIGDNRSRKGMIETSEQEVVVDGDEE